MFINQRIIFFRFHQHSKRIVRDDPPFDVDPVFQVHGNAFHFLDRGIQQTILVESIGCALRHIGCIKAPGPKASITFQS